MKIALILTVFLGGLIALPAQTVSDDGRVRTFLSGRIWQWEVTMRDTDGTFEAYMKDDVNRWTFEIGSLTGEVNTEMHDVYDRWEITINGKVYSFHTQMKNSWNKWELTDPDTKSTTTFTQFYSNSWNHWVMENDSLHADIETYTSQSWEDWEIETDEAHMTNAERIAALFFPIFISRVYRPLIAK